MTDRLATSVVESLKGQPVIFVIVLLNVIMLVTAAWFLAKQEKYRHTERMQILQACLTPRGGTP